MVKAKQPPGAPMTLGNMRHLGVQHLIASCLNDACRHQGIIDVSKYPDDTEVPSFAAKVVCAKCGARGRHIDVRPNWKGRAAKPSLTGKVWR
jgi:hypothetical protein